MRAAGPDRRLVWLGSISNLPKSYATAGLTKTMNDGALVLTPQHSPAPEHRLRAAHDLVSRIPARAPRRIADAFTGQGSMEPLLVRRFPDAEIETLDLSQSAGR